MRSQGRRARQNGTETTGQRGVPGGSGQLDSELETNLSRIRTELASSPDLIVRKFTLRTESRLPVAAVYLDSLTNKDNVNDFVIRSLLTPSLPEPPADAESPEEIFRYVCDNALAVAQFEIVGNWTTMLLELLTGKTILLVDGWAECISGNTIGGETRAVSEASTQVVIRGPKDSFTESVATNVALVRRRIRSPKFGFEAIKIGTITQTTVVMMYIEGIAKNSIVQEVRTRLGKIDTDAILESGYIEEFIEDNWFSPFPTIYNTERPDVVAANLIEGRIAILVDGTPFVLIAPTVLSQFFAAAEDYYQRYDIGSFIRLLRYMAFVISLFGPAIYIALTTFHQEMLPMALLINLTAAREGVPFPALIEAFAMELCFEILREAGIRMPRAVGQAVSIVGALVLGEAAVQAGIVSPIMVIVVAITAIANFSIPSYNLAITARMLRFLFMLAAGFLGFYGIVLGMIMLVAHINSLRSFGVAFLSPIVPFRFKQMKDIFIRTPHWTITERPDEVAADLVKTPPGEGPRTDTDGKGDGVT
ncbi:spore germination protein [Cohnella faecalis]|uniref:Spore germination protein n=1 Tax=Cohnella faecalis TaxID=2315694 RepID=A0A398CNI3_9BACL|nr:spore germination protein [Cohnella faecalis]RIE02809.1 spore germination protein [Cohnella faecalis]